MTAKLHFVQLYGLSAENGFSQNYNIARATSLLARQLILLTTLKLGYINRFLALELLGTGAIKYLNDAIGFDQLDTQKRYPGQVIGHTTRILDRIWTCLTFITTY
jgi:hypothetical protein